MARRRTFFWLSTLIGIAVVVWRWRQRQLEDVHVPPYVSPTAPPAGRSSALPTALASRPAAESASAASASSGPRRIVTRVHRGAPPSSNGAPAAEAAPAVEATSDAAVEPVVPAEPAAPPAEVAPAAGEPPAMQTLAMPTSTNAAEAPAAGTAPAGPVNINTAGEAELIALPGIGPALAKRIIAYREANGPFASVEDLVHIQGIGPRNINDFAGLVTVE